MDKATLKARWGKYCDTDKLVDDVMNLLTKYHHKNTENGVCQMLHVYFLNKHDLIDLFQKSPNYVGDMRIVFDIELERYNNARDIKDFCYYFPMNVDAHQEIEKSVDKDGKTLEDYTRVGFTTLKVTDLLQEDVVSKFKANTEHKAQFRSDGTTKESYEKYSRFCDIMCQGFYYNHTPKIERDVEKYIKSKNENLKIVEGMKTSRAFNKACAFYGVDKLPKYNKLFAQYADMVSGLKRKLKFFMSLNPLDYLTMSFGVSWSSCHTIDKTNTRNMPDSYHGQYCGGTVSYMLDNVSFVTYAHQGIPEDVEEGKIYRCMFHYNGGKLVQGRIYPQGNDGATDLYQVFRGFVQKNLSEMLGVSNSWTKKSSRSDSVNTCGVQYPDYTHFSSCNVSYLNEVSGAKDRILNIGRERICPKCGHAIDNSADSGILVHGRCPT